MTIEDDISFFERVPTLNQLGRQALRILAIGAESRYGPTPIWWTVDVLGSGYSI
jgi:hypothetical protein